MALNLARWSDRRIRVALLAKMLRTSIESLTAHERITRDAYADAGGLTVRNRRITKRHTSET